jgi:hypothetical protein
MFKNYKMENVSFATAARILSPFNCAASIHVLSPPHSYLGMRHAASRRAIFPLRLAATVSPRLAVAPG